MSKITINGKVYQAVEIDMNFVCDMEEAGITLNELSNKTVSAFRCYVAACMGVDIRTAGNAITEHAIKNNTIDDLMEVFNTKVEESDFFRSLNKTATEETAEITEESKEEE